MNNEISNTGKPAQQSAEQAPEDKASMPTTQDNATLIRRRRLLKGLGAAPLVMTLHSGAAMAARSNDITSCRGTNDDNPIGCVENPDNYVRIEVNKHDGTVDGVVHPLFNGDGNNKKNNLCLINVDARGDMLPIDDDFNSDLVVTTSCWTSFV